jgi:hypothetical protein
MLVALIYMYLQAGDYAIASFHDLRLDDERAGAHLLSRFLLAFAVKCRCSRSYLAARRARRGARRAAR